MTNPLTVTYWILRLLHLVLGKKTKHRIYLKLSEKDNAFNKMDYGANDLDLEIIMENGSEKINNLSTVSNHSQLKRQGDWRSFC